MLTTLVTHESSSSPKVSKCPHTKNNSIFINKDEYIEDQISDAMLTLTERNTIHVFTHRFSLISQLIFGPSYARSKRSF